MKANLKKSLRTSSYPSGLSILKVSLFVLSLSAVACSSSTESESDDNISANDTLNVNMPPIENNGDQATARYRLTFTAQWSMETHPLNFPGNPHFSGLVGAVHNEQMRFWEPAQIASEGIQLMAETGSKSTLLSEVEDAIDAGSALSTIDGGGIGRSPGSTSVEFVVSRDYPQITVTSMLAPSPDWFIGVHNHSLMSNGEFIEGETIDLLLYDSGSDNGLRYTSFNEETNPLAPISRVNNAVGDGPFVDGLPSIGTFTLERLPN